MNILHKILFALVVTLITISCNSGKKQTHPQSKTQDSTRVEQPEFPPLEAGVVEYQDDEAFGEVIELEGRQFVPDSFIFRPRNAKVVVKGKYLVMRVDVFSQDLHPFIIFDYPEMTYVTEFGKYGNGPDEFIFGDIIPTTDPDCLCYLMEITRDKLYKLTRKGGIVPYSYSFRSSTYQENFKEYIHNIGKDDFIYTDKSKSGRSIFRSYPEGDSIVCKELHDLNIDKKIKDPFLYAGDLAINSRKNRMVYAYKQYKKLKFMTIDASIVKELNPPTLSIPGIGIIFCANIISEYGDMSRFKSADACVAFAGIEPSISQSGTENHDGKMVKHGSGNLRFYLLNAADYIVMHIPEFTEYYYKKRNEGKTHRVALSHVAKKLVRLIYKLETENIMFDSTKLK